VQSQCRVQPRRHRTPKHTKKWKNDRHFWCNTPRNKRVTAYSGWHCGLDATCHITTKGQAFHYATSNVNCLIYKLYPGPKVCQIYIELQCSDHPWRIFSVIAGQAQPGRWKFQPSINIDYNPSIAITTGQTKDITSKENLYKTKRRASPFAQPTPSSLLLQWLV
jgi:hypothetical protein